MQYIKRSECPQLLATNRKSWTFPWVLHYRWQKCNSTALVQPPKPQDSHWLKDEIRILLMNDFHNNCGYCGEAIPTPQEDKISKGDVEHFSPKSIYPERVYQWTNYVWSCKPCNQLKSNKETKKHYNKNYLNPCRKKDCENLMFSEDTGRYVLQDTVANNDYWKERLRNSELKTMLNAEEISEKRKLRTSMLRQRFNSIETYLTCIHKCPELQKQIDNSVTEISDIMNSPDFYYLLQKQYQLLLLNHPQIAVILNI